MEKIEDLLKYIKNYSSQHFEISSDLLFKGVEVLALMMSELSTPEILKSWEFRVAFFWEGGGWGDVRGTREALLLHSSYF